MSLRIVEADSPTRHVFREGDESVVELIVIPDILGRRPVGYIHKVVTAEECQDKGFATELMIIALASAKDMGCYKVFLICGDENRGFYERLGFKPHQSGMELRL